MKPEISKTDSRLQEDFDKKLSKEYPISHSAGSTIEIKLWSYDREHNKMTGQEVIPEQIFEKKLT